MKTRSYTRGYLLIVIAGIFYGFTGVFVTNLSNYNIPTSVIAFYRPFIAFIFIFILILIKNKEYLKFDKKVLIYFILLGTTTQTLFNMLYFAAIEKTTITTAAVLMFTAPIFVAILARLLYKELFTLPKAIALVVSVVGCFLASTGGSLEHLRLNALGLTMGIGAGIMAALAPIINKKLAGKVHYLTIACYTMGFGALSSFIIVGPKEIVSINYNINIWVNILGLGAIANAIGYLFYTAAMSHKIQSSKASIVNTIEVPVATLTSLIFFKESILGLKLLGVILVILSVVIIEYGNRFLQRKEERFQETL